MSLKKYRFKIFAFCLASMATIFSFGVSAGRAAEKTIKIAYVEWSSSIASGNLVKAVLEEKLGIRCELVGMTADGMWSSVATRKADAMLSAWLPDVHGHYYSQTKEMVVDLGPNLEGTKVGLVVPNIYAGRLTSGTGIRNRPVIPADSIPELAEYADRFNDRIIGIDPEAGIMKMAEKAIDVYGLGRYRLIEGSEISMVAELSNAIRHQKWIVVTGWRPHWMFARWDLKFLDDPENVFGGQGHINTIARKGLEADMPVAHDFLDNFYWTPEEMARLMLWIQEDRGLYPYEKALRWIRTHPERVKSWLK